MSAPPIGHELAEVLADIECTHSCADCGIDTLRAGEYYMLRDEIWRGAGVTENALLCIGCVEKRLGRTLGSSDFFDCPLNEGHILGVSIPQSKRLRERLNRRTEGSA